ncbi:PqqD family protein [Caenimonas koreensis]|uniref:PqqD family peptide modification chaperone n=1 Tax=Caenimonas koreensis DSM 17982 TaxID=1121255 RepID=A0A844AR64_9BURK|nr:PqqD family protein [Caenimonas koreensis]MRD46820.1 PqqD family peptide modification chaperone [Caenimonas koreensis DSM 17982]
MSIEGTVTIPKQVMARRVGEEVVLLDLLTGTYFGLDPVGSRVWDLLAAGHSLAQVSGVVIDEYDVTPEAFGKDLEALLRDLQARGLIAIKTAT